MLASCGSGDLLKFEFMIFAFRFHQELVDKTKTAIHQDGGFGHPVEILFSEFCRRTSTAKSLRD